MSRVPIAVIGGLLGFLLYVGAVIILADLVLGRHWLLQALYFLVAGFAWTWPVMRLMYWAARKS